MYFVENGRDEQHEGRRSPQAAPEDLQAYPEDSFPTTYGEQMPSLKHFC